MKIFRLALLGAMVLLACGCAPASPEVVGPLPGMSVPPSTAYPGVSFIDDVDFGAADGIRLDVCMPESRGPRPLPAIISVHGGGWSAGDKAQRPWRDTCAWLASEGFVVFQTNYRLAPAHPYPVAIDDITMAVEWIRADAQTKEFGHDPARLGAFGDSAGGNLVSLLGTRGEGGTRAGTRVAAVVELSAPLDLTRAGAQLGELSTSFQQVQLDYLACASYDDCPQAEAASPHAHIDATDPPFLILHSTGDFIPVEQAEAFTAGLERSGVDVTFTEVDGAAHALGMLDAELRGSIADWLKRQLASP